MLGNINPRQMQKMMQRMGMQQTQIDAIKVIIKTKDKDYVFNNPEVAKINMMGQQTWQVTGEFSEVSAFSSDDVQTVMNQANVSREKAESALKNSEGDLAKAIMSLSE